MENKGYIKVPVGVVLAFVNCRLAGADIQWIKRLYSNRKVLAQRYLHLKGKTTTDFLPGSYCLVQDFYLAPEQETPVSDKYTNEKGIIEC